VALAAVALASVALAIGLLLTVGSGGPSGPKTAAIIDQLSLTVPNPQFAEAATGTLEKAGYTVDYFPGEEVTVDFYRGLPARGYDLILLRSHSSRLQEHWEDTEIDEVILFTSEPYSEVEYVEEQEAGQLAIARYTEGGEPYFGIAPGFITSSMRGSFDGATVVLMGCEGLSTHATGKAILEMGAESVISWTGLVTATHTDLATEELVDLLVLGELPPDEAVAQTMAKVGPDPSFGSELLLLAAD